jgi:hypothetical protein
MKFIVSILLIALLSFVASIYLPWWVIAIVGFIIAFAIPQKPILAFLSGFLALFLLWASLSYSISSANEHLFAHKLSVLFIKNDNPIMLIMVTGLIGGLVAGFGSLSGRLFKKIFTTS